MAVMINRSNISAVVHVTANVTIVVAGNSSVSNIASPGEELTGASITQVWYGVANGGLWRVKRGSNTVLVLESTGYVDFAGAGASLIVDPSANIVATLEGTTNGYLMLEVQKNPATTGYTS